MEFPIPHPGGVSPVLCWTSDGQFTLCGASSVLLSPRVCSSRMAVVVHLTCLGHMTILGGAPSVAVTRKGWFWWRILSPGSSQGRKDTLSNLPLHFVQFLLPPFLHSPPPPVGIGFSKDQVTWFQWNGISFPIISALLSLCLWCGLHRTLFKGFLQPFTQLGNVEIYTLVFLCPLSWRNRSQWVSMLGIQT